MNKIFNWTVGSFFRSIGRILAYILIGGLIFFLLGKTGLISFLHVNASTLSIPVTKYQSSYFELTNQLDQVSYGYKIPLTRSNGSNSVNNIFLQFRTPINGSQFDYIQFDFLLGVPQYSELNNDSTLTGRYCREYSCSLWNNNNTVCEEWYCSQATSYSQGTINNNEIYPLTLNDLNFSTRIEYTDGNFAFCDIQNGKIVCPTNRSNSIKGIDLYYNFHSTHIADATFILYQATEYYKINDNQQIINSIDNQSQQQQQQHQEIMESNTTQAENEASNFFGNFTTEDHGGINAIITAPLNTIQSLLSSTCTNLVLPLPFVDEDLELPCMNAIYTEHFGLFFQLYQTIILAIISYRCLRSIFYDINGFTNPDDDRIEVMDL